MLQRHYDAALWPSQRRYSAQPQLSVTMRSQRQAGSMAAARAHRTMNLRFYGDLNTLGTGSMCGTVTVGGLDIVESIDPFWVSNLMFWAPEHSPKCWYHENRGRNELWHYRLCIQSPLLYRSTTGPIPQPPLPAAQSRESRIGSHRTAQIRPKSGRPRPLAWPTTCCQVWPLLKVSLAHSSHRSTTQRARPWPPVVIRGR